MIWDIVVTVLVFVGVGFFLSLLDDAYGTREKIEAIEKRIDRLEEKLDALMKDRKE